MRMGAMAALVSAALLGASSARADDTVHTGFMARLGLGVGYLSASESVGSYSAQVSGIAGSGELALGGYVLPGFAIHLTAWGSTAFGPSVSITSSSGTASGTANNGSLTASAIGAGVTYYIANYGIYLTGSIGAGLLSESVTSGAITTSSNTSLGLAFCVGLGDQWALSDNWGLGIAGFFGWQSNADNNSAITGSSPTITTMQAGARLSVTYH